jgi:hypothetical protein
MSEKNEVQNQVEEIKEAKDEYEPVAEKLSIEKLEQYEQALKDSERVEFSIEYEGKEETVYITVDKVFTKTSISACINEYVRNVDKLRKRKVDIENGFLEMYLLFMLIKHFTDLDMPTQIEKQLIVMERLINTGLIFYIFMEFPQEQIAKLMRELDKLTELFVQQLENVEEEMKNLDLSKLESEQVKDFIQKE